MQYTDEFLESLRHIGDPVPDQIIADLNGEHKIDDVNRVLHNLIKSSQVVPAELPDNIEFWLKENWQLPLWVDRHRLDRGSEFFVEHGIPISLILPTAVLIECYAAVKGVKVLSTTYRLGQNPYRRVAETAQFVLNVLTPGSLYGDGVGIPTILKIRLIHSAIRLLMRKYNAWNDATDGVPVCQEDMLGSLLAYSHSTVTFMRKLGIEVKDEEAEDYYYLWKVIGIIMGIQPEFLPDNFHTAGVLADRIKQRHLGPSPEGVKMTQAILEMFNDLIPGGMFDGVVPAVIRHLVGPQIADWLEVPHSRWEVFVSDHDQTIMHVLGVLDTRTGVIADIIDQLGLAFLSRTAIAATGYERTGFEIPSSLQAAWKERGKMS